VTYSDTGAATIANMKDETYQPFAGRLEPTKAKPATPLWTLTKDSGSVRCDITEDGHGAEVRLFRDSAFYASRRLSSRAAAEQHAADLRLDLERDGWKGGLRS